MIITIIIDVLYWVKKAEVYPAVIAAIAVQSTEEIKWNKWTALSDYE